MSVETGGGTPAMFDRALRLARDPALAADDEEMLSAASDLVAWGAFDDALAIVQRLETTGLYGKETRYLRKAIDRNQETGPAFDQHLLAHAMETVRDPNASTKALLKATDNLLSWGALDDADIAISRVERDERLRGEAAAMKATSRQLRRSGVLSAFSVIGSRTTSELNRPYEVLIARGDERADKVIIAFTGALKRFWLSLHVLHHYLSAFGAHVIYLSDHSNSIYLNGLDSIGGGYPGLVSKLCELVNELDAERKYVMATSSGGFIGLRAAADIGAEAFLGIAVTTNLAADNRIQLSPYERAAIDRCRDVSLLINLRTYLAARGSPQRIMLYAGDGEKNDVAQAENLRGLANVELYYLSEFRWHNVMPALIARGQFESVLHHFLARSVPNASA